MKSLEKVVDFFFFDKLRYLSRFSVVGVLNTVVDFAAFTLLNGLFGVNYLISQFFGYGFGTLNSFILNKKWTFNDNKSKKILVNELGEFLVINTISLLLTLLFMNVFINDLNINVYVSKIAVTLIAQIVNFLGYKLWVFN